MQTMPFSPGEGALKPAVHTQSPVFLNTTALSEQHFLLLAKNHHPFSHDMLHVLVLYCKGLPKKPYMGGGGEQSTHCALVVLLKVVQFSLYLPLAQNVLAQVEQLNRLVTLEKRRKNPIMHIHPQSLTPTKFFCEPVHKKVSECMPAQKCIPKGVVWEMTWRSVDKGAGRQGRWSIGACHTACIRSAFAGICAAVCIVASIGAGPSSAGLLAQLAGCTAVLQVIPNPPVAFLALPVARLVGHSDIGGKRWRIVHGACAIGLHGASSGLGGQVIWTIVQLPCIGAEGALWTHLACVIGGSIESILALAIHDGCGTCHGTCIGWTAEGKGGLGLVDCTRAEEACQKCTERVSVHRFL